MRWDKDRGGKGLGGGLSNVTSDDSTHIYLMLIMDKRRGTAFSTCLGGVRGKGGKEKGRKKKTLLYVHRKNIVHRR